MSRRCAASTFVCLSPEVVLVVPDYSELEDARQVIISDTNLMFSGSLVVS